MDTVKLSSKGQIVIPKNIRDDLHLPPGTEFVIKQTPTGLMLTPIAVFPKVEPKAVRGVLAKHGRGIGDEDTIKARIKARLKAQDDATR